MSDASATPTTTETTPTPADAGAQTTVLGTTATPPAPATEAAPQAPAAPAVPENYEFTAPQIDGKPIEVDGAALDSFKSAAKDAGLTQEQFAKVASLGAQMIQQKLGEAVAAAMPEHMKTATQDGWIATIKADTEIGGDKLGASLAEAAKVLDAFGGAALREAMVLTRAGNHPEIVKAFVKIGRAMGDPTGLFTGRPAVGSKPVNGEQAAREFYNNAGGTYAPVEVK